MKTKKFLVIYLLYFIPIFGFSQTEEQINEINKRGLKIEQIKNVWGKLDLNKGDGFSYKSLKDGDYNNNNYMLEVYVFYAGKVYNGIKRPSSFSELSKERRKEYLLYFVNKFDRDTIIEWENNEWTYSKLLIDNLDLWEYINNF